MKLADPHKMNAAHRIVFECLNSVSQSRPPGSHGIPSQRDKEGEIAHHPDTADGSFDVRPACNLSKQSMTKLDFFKLKVS